MKNFGTILDSMEIPKNTCFLRFGFEGLRSNGDLVIK